MTKQNPTQINKDESNRKFLNRYVPTASPMSGCKSAMQIPTVLNSKYNKDFKDKGGRSQLIQPINHTEQKKKEPIKVSPDDLFHLDQKHQVIERDEFESEK